MTCWFFDRQVEQSLAYRRFEGAILTEAWLP